MCSGSGGVAGRPKRRKSNSHTAMNDTASNTTLRMVMTPKVVGTCFAALFSKGMQFRICQGVSLKDFLCRQVGMPEDYLENRVQTVFLDGRPVDDVKAVSLANGATVALSAAMPGLAGAVLRKSGALAVFRKDITYHRTDSADDACEARITVKLFNLTMRETGPMFLQHGVWLDGHDLREVLIRRADLLERECRAAFLNEAPIGTKDLPAKLRGRGTVFLQVEIEEAPSLTAAAPSDP